MSPKQTSPTPSTSFAYILGSDGKGGYRTYVGWATDLEKRLERHNSGAGARSTRGRQWRLLYAEGFATRGQAMSREWHLKRDRKFRQALASAWRGNLS
ncbi:MAG: GIY-YIG nuclease family protein [Rhodospirillales bacterium]|nr:GIY-YIG nuclease family protein [Rhodospirillales bacterium]